MSSCFSKPKEFDEDLTRGSSFKDHQVFTWNLPSDTDYTFFNNFEVHIAGRA